MHGVCIPFSKMNLLPYLQPRLRTVNLVRTDTRAVQPSLLSEVNATTEFKKPNHEGITIIYRGANIIIIKN